MWERKPSLTRGGASGSAVSTSADNKTVILTGGWVDNERSRKTEVFSDGKWTAGISLPSVLVNHWQCQMGTKTIVISTLFDWF